jgi:hypothetical protein
MKIGKQLPAVSAINPQERREALLRDAPAPLRAGTPVDTPHTETAPSKNTSFSMQLNQQLSSMQSADSYLGDLQTRLSQLKLNLSRQISSPQPNGEESIRQTVQQVGELLKERSKRSGNSLDANLKLRLTEPVRSRFSLQGLESLEKIRQSGRETLLFSGGRQLAEPVAVVLDGRYPRRTGSERRAEVFRPRRRLAKAQGPAGGAGRRQAVRQRPIRPRAERGRAAAELP